MKTIQKLLKHLFKDIETQKDTKATTYCKNCRKETITQKGYIQDFGFRYTCQNPECNNPETPGTIKQKLYKVYVNHELTPKRR